MSCSKDWEHHWQGNWPAISVVLDQLRQPLTLWCSQGGEIIRELREQTGTKIKVEDPVPHCEDRVVTIIGPDRYAMCALRHCSAYMQHADCLQA